MSRPFTSDRRQFLKQLSLAGAATFIPGILADPYAPLVRPVRASAPVRIRGRVHAGGQSMAGVAVADGRSVVRTAIPSAAILLPAAFFLSVLQPDATEPNGFIYLAYVGAVVLVIGLVILGIGLIRKPGNTTG